MNETDRIKELEKKNTECFFEIQGLRKANADLKEYIEKFTIRKEVAKDLLCLAIDNGNIESPF